MSTLDTPEHAAYRAMILAYGTEDYPRFLELQEHENKIEDLTHDRDSLNEYVTELEGQVTSLERKIKKLESALDELQAS